MTTLAQVQEILIEQLGVAPEAVVETAKLQDDLGVDSLGVMDIIMDIEDKFEITVPEDAAGDIVTVADLVTKIDELK